MSREAELVLAGVVAECCVLLLLILRRAWKSTPAFTFFTLWTIISDSSFVFTHLYLHGLRPYLIEMSIDSTLQFLVFAELMWSVLRPVRSALPRGAVAAIPLILLAVGAICWPLAGFSVPGGLSTRGHLLVTLQQTVALLRVIVFLVMVAFSHVLSIGWRDRELQIASGLGFYSILSLIVSVFHTHQVVGPQYHWLDLAASIGYLCTLTYWVVCFSIKEPERKKISPQMQHFLVTIGGAVQAERFALESAVGQNRGKNSSKRRNQ